VINRSMQTLTVTVMLLFIAPAAHCATAAVSMPDRYAAAASEQVLRDGGNAIDAAIAAAFVLAVTYPEAGNIGGGGFMVSYMDGQAQFLDFRELSPAAAHRDMYLDKEGNVIPNASLVGARAVGVPGTVRGMQLAHQRYGTVPWKKLLQPAIKLAREGFIAPDILEEYARKKVAEFDGVTNFAKYFGHLRSAELFKQAELAATLDKIASSADSFYHGEIAGQIVAQMQASGGLITLSDLADYRAVWRAPLRAQWRGYTVLTAPPPSSGGFALIQLLSMREHAHRHFEGIEHNSPQYLHLLAEIEKHVFADRAEYLGDPDSVAVPIAQLLDDAYLMRRANEINPRAISPSTQVQPGLESTDTTHFSVLDRHGNAVSLTYTLNWEFGSGVIVEGAGFALNNQMDDFSAKPGVKNKFGVIGNSNNAIAPRRRMLSSMTPTILLKDAKPALIIGTPGGSTIFTSVLQVVLNLYDHGMPLNEAINSTRFHHQLPDAYVLRHDQRQIPASTRRALESMGYTVEPNSWGDLGNIAAIYSDGQGVQTAVDKRGRGDARLVEAP
jgi:gamma-glutamyltranspeptidase / glutathione hydrolase